VKRTKPRPPLSVTADGKGIASHAGTRLLAEMADFTGLTDALSEVSTAIRNSPLAATRIPQGRSREFPAYGHGSSPVI
jgi:hypothetical protein